MTGKKKCILMLVVLLAVAAGIFSYVRVPGTAIYGLTEVLEHSRGNVTMIEVFFIHSDDGVMVSHQALTEFYLDGEQIEMLRDLFLGATFRRSSERPRIVNLEGVEREANYLIQFNDIPNHPDVIAIFADGDGYFRASLGRDRISTLRIWGSQWEDALLDILALTPEERMLVRG